MPSFARSGRTKALRFYSVHGFMSCMSRPYSRQPALGTRERFFKKVKQNESGCWIWTGCLTAMGYSRFKFDGRVGYAHRYSYCEFRGPIPKNLEIDHLCRNRACVNPWHLQAVTASENQRRSPFKNRLANLNRAKTHCPAGHPYSGHNLFFTSRGGRSCRKCHNARCVRLVRAARQRARAKIPL